jgi:Ca2+/Na+ antiporter
MGWVLILLGIIQLAGGFSLINGKTFGRIIAIVGASLGALGALFSISGPNPWWSLAVFFLCIYVIHGIFIYGDDTADLNP